MIDTAKIKANILSCAFKGMLVDFNVEKSNEALDELQKENKKYVPVKEDEYLTEVPSRWQWSRLGYVTNNHGQKEPQEDFCYIDVGTLDNINHCLAKKENLVNKEEAPSRARKIVEQGDVLYSTVRPYLHNICIINKDFSRMPVASTAFCVMAVEEKVLINKYLFYWLLSPEFDKFSNGNPSKGTLYPAIGEKDLLNGVIPIPDIEEQKLIVEKLDSVFEHLDKLNRLQTLYTSDLEVLKSKIIDAGIQGKLTEQLPEDGTAEELLEQIDKEKKALKDAGIYKNKKKITIKKSISKDEIFEIPKSWKWVRLGQLADVYGRIGFRGYTKADLVEAGQGAISMSPSNITFSGDIIFENNTYITWEKYDESPEIKIREGDVLIVKTGSSFGKTGIVEKMPEKCTINPQLAILKNILCDRYYLNLYMKCSHAWKQYDSFVVGAATPTFSQEKLANMLIPLPPLNEQKRIVDRVKRIFDVV